MLIKKKPVLISETLFPNMNMNDVLEKLGSASAAGFSHGGSFIWFQRSKPQFI